MKNTGSFSIHWQSEKTPIWTYYREREIMQEDLASKTQTEILLMTEGFELNKWTDSHRILDNSQRLFSNSRRVGALDII